MEDIKEMLWSTRDVSPHDVKILTLRRPVLVLGNVACDQCTVCML